MIRTLALALASIGVFVGIGLLIVAIDELCGWWLGRKQHDTTVTLDRVSGDTWHG